MSQNISALAEFVSFAIGANHYGVDIMAVREIRGWTEIARLPDQPDYMRGVLNLRGAVVPIVDLRCRFGEGMTQTTPQHVVIIVSIEKKLVGILADRVLDIVAFEVKKIQPVPQLAVRTGADILSGLISRDEGMIAVIELTNLVATADVEAPAARQGQAA